MRQERREAKRRKARKGDTDPRARLRDGWSGRQDSNLQPPAPHTGALPNCATPRQRHYSTPRRDVQGVKEAGGRYWT